MKHHVEIKEKSKKYYKLSEPRDTTNFFINYLETKAWSLTFFFFGENLTNTLLVYELFLETFY